MSGGGVRRNDERALDEILPWDHFDVGVRKAGLLREHHRAGLSPEPVAAG